MKKVVTILLLLGIAVGVYSCKKYQDKPAVNDPRLGNPYCNDPNAVNYNWGFPGTPDNTVCFYPTDVFAGVYEFHDSVFLAKTGFFVSADTIMLTIVKLSDSTMTLAGLCSPGGLLSMKAGITFSATVDTTMGDSVTFQGQAFCTTADTVNGTLVKDRINDSIVYVNLLVAADTGVITNHLGTARLKHK